MKVSNMKIKFAAITALFFAFAATSRSQTSWTISSPNGSVRATIQLTNLNGTADYPDSTRLYYSVSLTKPSVAQVVPASPMGLARSDANFVDGLSFVSETLQTQVDSTYNMAAGKRKVCRDFCNEKTLTFASTNGSKLEIVLRAYNEGFAFRYRFPETNTNAFTVTSEETGIRMPAKSTAWMMAYDQFTDGKYQPAYENYWNNAIPAGTLSTAVPTASSPPSGWALPALFQTPSGQYALFFETDVTESYCGSHLGEPTNNVYRIAQPLAPEGAGRGSVNPSYSLPWSMPWRVVVVGATPAPVLENTLAFDLASPCVLADVSWIKPGRSSWSWWSDSNTHNYKTHIAFVDLAQQMGWEYCLLDGGWQTITNGGNWQSVLKYAKDRNVGITVWFTSGANGAPSVLMDPATRKAEFDRLSAAGVKGVKIDFFHSDKQWTMKYYLDILKDAAADHLLVDFHGCTIARGWQRTYPNLMTMEAVRGAEYYKFNATYPAGEPVRHTILPFTRNSVASMDYTPVTFSNNRRAHITTYGHELALSIVFESGIQHFADRVSGYSTNTISPAAQTFLQQVPVTWDDTKYLLGTPGAFVVLAREKGNDWYIGGISGEETGRTVTVPLSFLAPGTTYRMTRIADGASGKPFDEQASSVASTDSITVPMLARGGFVARLTPNPGAKAGLKK